jgi:BirA family biotin operon repressor/biotin-[acetyl-CoA-carboxylase] ligase
VTRGGPEVEGDLAPARIAAARRGRFGAPLEVVASLPSTQSAVLEWSRAGAPEGAVMVADHQTQGRGRRGRTWLSAPGRALQFSLLLRPTLVPDRAGVITTALGVAVAEAVEETSGLPSRTRWPNDVTVEGRKVAGILVETRVQEGALEAAVAGVGINVEWPCAQLPGAIAASATSISCEVERLGAGAVPGRAELLAAALGRIEELYDAAARGSDSVVARASARSETVGRPVSVRLAGGGSVVGTATRLLASGALEIDVDGERHAVDAGEIERARPA